MELGIKKLIILCYYLGIQLLVFYIMYNCIVQRVSKNILDCGREQKNDMFLLLDFTCWSSIIVSLLYIRCNILLLEDFDLLSN